MILLYSGTPGSGKSLDMARLIYYKSARHPILCNFAVNLPQEKLNNVYYVNDDILTPAFLIDFSYNYFKVQGHKFKEEEIFLFIDEAQIYFNTREWGRKDRKDWIKFFSMHRHYGYEIILACQMDIMLDKQVRGLIETEVKHRKVNSMGWRGVFLRCLFFSPTLFIKVHFYYPMKQKTSSDFFRYCKKFASLYDSYDTSFFETSGAPDDIRSEGATDATKKLDQAI